MRLFFLIALIINMAFVSFARASGDELGFHPIINAGNGSVSYQYTYASQATVANAMALGTMLGEISGDAATRHEEEHPNLYYGILWNSVGKLDAHDKLVDNIYLSFSKKLAKGRYAPLTMAFGDNVLNFFTAGLASKMGYDNFAILGTTSIFLDVKTGMIVDRGGKRVGISYAQHQGDLRYGFELDNATFDQLKHTIVVK